MPTPPAEMSFDSTLESRATISAASLDMLFRRYLNREADEKARAFYLGKEWTLGQVEASIRGSREYRRVGRMVSSQDRSHFDRNLLYIQPARIALCAMEKVASTSLKAWALRLSGITDIPPGSRVLERLHSTQSRIPGYNWPAALREQIGRDPAWAVVAVLRNPADRLVSCYCDKFGRHRFEPLNLQHTARVYAWFNDGAEPDRAVLQKGISFRQFCHYINATPREEHDPHWLAQWEYLKNRKWDRLFALERIGEFEAFVRARLPEELRHIRLGLSNSNTRDDSGQERDVSDLLPDQWLRAANPPYRAFLAEDIMGFVRDYYSLDYHLYENALAGTG